MTTRLWIDKDSVNKSLNEEGDLIISAEDFYFFKRNEISNEDGYHLEFASASGGFEIYMTYLEYQRFIRQMINKLLDYSEQTDYNI